MKGTIAAAPPTRISSWAETTPGMNAMTSVASAANFILGPPPLSDFRVPTVENRPYWQNCVCLRYATSPRVPSKNLIWRARVVSDQIQLDGVYLIGYTPGGRAGQRGRSVADLGSVGPAESGRWPQFPSRPRGRRAHEQHRGAVATAQRLRARADCLVERLGGSSGRASPARTPQESEPLKRRHFTELE